MKKNGNNKIEKEEKKNKSKETKNNKIKEVKSLEENFLSPYPPNKKKTVSFLNKKIERNQDKNTKDEEDIPNELLELIKKRPSVSYQTLKKYKKFKNLNVEI